MYRLIERKVYGVLTDFDLASRTVLMDDDYTRTSQQRTGTPPFMAHGLLDGTDPLHLYRHDVESLFYIMLILATHYEIQASKKGEVGGVRMRQGKLPFERWFDQPSYEDLASFKLTFFSKLGAFEVSPSFKDFRSWLLHLQASFTGGFQAKAQHDFQQGMQRQLLMDTSEKAEDKVEPAAFDDETLGGHVTYSALIRPARHPTGALKGLSIRFDPPSLLPPPSDWCGSRLTPELVPGNTTPLLYLFLPSSCFKFEPTRVDVFTTLVTIHYVPTLNTRSRFRPLCEFIISPAMPSTDSTGAR
jgi:hypothetical protein